MYALPFNEAALLRKMPALGRKRVRYQEPLRNAREFVQRQGGQIAPLAVSEEEINPHETDDITNRAVHIEDMSRVYPVPYAYPEDAGLSEFRFFEDGRQRTLQIGHIPTYYGGNLFLLPVHFFTVASVILERRENARLHVWRSGLIRQGVLVARSLVPDQNILREFEEAGLEVVDTDSGAPSTNEYYALRTRALREAKRLRLDVESKLISDWQRSPDSGSGFLVVDGTLMNLRTEAAVDRCVGVSKSFGSRYFEVSDHHRIMSLREFERSWAFRFHNEEEDDLRMGARERVSWYLRLRQGRNADPEFGLVRVEISKAHVDRASELANRFSRSLISERLPTSYPAPRWDKHLYPIRQCENYLSSVTPSGNTIRASMRA